jgi:hypothetical protein
LTGVSDNLEQLWKVDNEDCINVIKMTWVELNICTMNECCRCLSPEVANSFMAFQWLRKKVLKLGSLQMELEGRGFKV